MTLMTFGRKAGLGNYVLKKREQALSNLHVSKTYYRTAAAANGMTAEMRSFHDIAYLTGIYSVLEAYLTDLASEVLLCFPDKLKNSEIKLKEAYIGAYTLVHDAVEAQVDNLPYQGFPAMVEAIAKMFVSQPFTHQSLETIVELKATRDIYVHNDGNINDTYRRKAGLKAREPRRPDSKLPLGEIYLLAGVDAAIDFVAAFYDHGPKGMEIFCPAKAFEEMWEATALNGLVPFAEAWKVEGPDSVRLGKGAQEWGWSTSEKYLYDFFLYVYNPEHPARTSDLAQALERWPPSSAEGRVILAWMDSPFYF